MSVLIGILADTRFCFAVGFCGHDSDATIITKFYPDLQEVMGKSKDEMIMCDMVFQNKFKDSSPPIIEGYLL